MVANITMQPFILDSAYLMTVCMAVLANLYKTNNWTESSDPLNITEKQEFPFTQKMHSNDKEENNIHHQIEFSISVYLCRSHWEYVFNMRIINSASDFNETRFFTVAYRKLYKLSRPITLTTQTRFWSLENLLPRSLDNCKCFRSSFGFPLLELVVN